MSNFYLPWNASNARKRDAERARQNRAEIVRELSWGRVSRRDLIKWGLFTSAGLLAPIGGLNPFVGSASADGDGIPRSPLFGAKPFTQPMPRFDVLPRHGITDLNPFCQPEANTTPIDVDPTCSAAASGPARGGRRERCGRTSGSISSRRRSASKRSSCRRSTNTSYDPQVPSSLNSVDRSVAADSGAVRTRDADSGSHLGLDVQRDDPAQAGAGPLRRSRSSSAITTGCPPTSGRTAASGATPSRRTSTTATTGRRTTASPAPSSSRASSTTTTGRSSSPATSASTPARPTPRPARPDGSGGLIPSPGRLARDDEHALVPRPHVQLHVAERLQGQRRDVQHLQRASIAATRSINDGVNLRLPSGTAKDWGNLDYDVNLMLADKAWDATASSPSTSSTSTASSAT